MLNKQLFRTSTLRRCRNEQLMASTILVWPFLLPLRRTRSLPRLAQKYCVDLFLNKKSDVFQAVFGAGNGGRSKSQRILAWPSKKERSVVKIGYIFQPFLIREQVLKLHVCYRGRCSTMCKTRWIASKQGGHGPLAWQAVAGTSRTKKEAGAIAAPASYVAAGNRYYM